MERANFESAVLRIIIVCSQFCLLLAPASSQLSEPRHTTTGPNYFNRSDFHSWILSRASESSTNTERPPKLAAPSQHRLGSGHAVEVAPPPNNQLLQYQIPKRNRANEGDAEGLSPQSAPVAILPANRSARTSAVAVATSYDHQADGDDYNLLVSNTCQRDHMLVEIRTSKPFHGLVHTLNHRRKPLCTAEADGGLLLRLSISHSLNPSDPQHCGVTRVAHSRASEPAGELLTLIVAVRLNRNSEPSEDKFFALNCTKPDCSAEPPRVVSGKLVSDLAKHSNGLHYLEREHLADEADLLPGAARSQSGARNVDRNMPASDCSVWRSAWILALILCLAIILLGMLISNLIICMSLRRGASRKKHQATPAQQPKESPDLESQQVEAREPRHERRKSRRKSRQIIYDNQDLDYDAARPQTSARTRQSDFLPLKEEHQQEKLKRSQVTSTRRASGETSRDYR